MMNYYIDESGNSGDLIHCGADIDFDGQPFFTLACVGVEDPVEVQKAVNEILRAHGLKEDHVLKSSSKKLLNRSGLFLDITKMLLRLNCPIFLEVVDKKYMVCMSIVRSQLAVNPIGSVTDERTAIGDRALADWLYKFAPDEVFHKFLNACRHPENASVRESFSALQQINPKIVNGLKDIELSCIRKLADYTAQEFEESVKANEDTHIDFLPPLPDVGKNGKLVWILPNLSSLTAIYARINKYHLTDLAKVRLVHDQQVHFNSILDFNKIAAEAVGARYSPGADFNFMESAELSFARSHETLGLQLADLMAGFSMRYFRSLLMHEIPKPEFEEALQRLHFRLPHPRSPLGINFYISTEMFEGLAWT